MNHLQLNLSEEVREEAPIEWLYDVAIGSHKALLRWAIRKDVVEWLKESMRERMNSNFYPLINYPIVGCLKEGREWVVIDGIHRILAAYELGLRSLKICKVKVSLYQAGAICWDSNKKTPHDNIEVFLFWRKTGFAPTPELKAKFWSIESKLSPRVLSFLEHYCIAPMKDHSKYFKLILSFKAVEALASLSSPELQEEAIRKYEELTAEKYKLKRKLGEADLLNCIEAVKIKANIESGKQERWMVEVPDEVKPFLTKAPEPLKRYVRKLQDKIQELMDKVEEYRLALNKASEGMAEFFKIIGLNEEFRDPQEYLKNLLKYKRSLEEELSSLRSKIKILEDEAAYWKGLTEGCKFKISI